MVKEDKGLVIGDATVDGEAVEPKITADEIIEVDDTTGPVATELASDDLSEDERALLLEQYYPLPEGFPDKKTLAAWEAENGRLRIHRIGPNEAYVIRALTRFEFRQYLAILKTKFGAAVVDPAEERMVQEELLVEKCLLWPQVTPEQIRGEAKPLHKIGLAGTVSILAYDVQEISNLIDSNVGPFEEV